MLHHITLKLDPPSPPCHLVFLAKHNGVYAIGLEREDDPRHVYCDSVGVVVKARLHDGDYGLELSHQLPFTPAPFNVKFFKELTNETIEAEVYEDDDFLSLQLLSNESLNIAAIAANMVGENESIDTVYLRMKFSASARSFADASLAVMMAGNQRLGSGSLLGGIGIDMLRMICNAYRLRLYECRNDVWF
jgi:hypothetical protein